MYTIMNKRIGSTNGNNTKPVARPCLILCFAPVKLPNIPLHLTSSYVWFIKSI